MEFSASGKGGLREKERQNLKNFRGFAAMENLKSPRVKEIKNQGLI
jgi:hypothetical protein